MAEGQKEEKKCFICGATKNLVCTEGIAQLADESATVMLKMELKHTKIKRVVTLPGHLSLQDLHYIIQAMFGFENGKQPPTLIRDCDLFTDSIRKRCLQCIGLIIMG